MVDYAAAKLTEFYLGLNDNSEVLSRARQLYPGLCKDNYGLKFVVLYDLIRCYRDQFYELDPESQEGLGLFLFTFITGEPEDRVRDYNLLSSSLSLGKQACVEAVESLDNQGDKMPHGVFLMEVILSPIDDSLVKRYFVLLYRFFSVIAKADGNIDEQESKYLSSLLDRTHNKTIVPSSGESRRADTDRTKRRYYESSKPRPNVDKLEDLPAMKELDALIGLGGVKDEIHSLANFVRVMLLRKKEGLKTAPLSLHCVFTGNPGTGKTTIARILGKIYNYLGLLETDKFVETDRSGLVAEYVGQTAPKTNNVIDSALDGVLFIDEAYSLVSSDKSDFGGEAISTLLKRMEDDRDRLVVILAGYTDNMEEFIQANPGLRSRFSRTIVFEDYNEEELYKIFELNLKKYEYVIEPKAAATLKETIRQAVEGRDKEFGNARYIRNIFEKVIQKQANRLAYLPTVSAESLTLITNADVQGLPLR